MFIDHDGTQVKISPLPDSSKSARLTSYALESSIFRNWLEGADPPFNISEISFQAITFRGKPSAKTVLFIRLGVKVSTAKHEQIIELRGHSSVMLVVLTSRESGVRFTPLLKQARLATGKFELIETPAGMIDEGSFNDAAFRELQEELGLNFLPEELTDITGIPEKEGGIYLSPGILDESCRFYSAERRMSRDQIQSLQDKTFGIAGEGEAIKVSVVAFDDIPRMTKDVKTLLAWALYHRHKRVI